MPGLVVDGPIRKIVEARNDAGADVKWKTQTWNYDADLVKVSAAHYYILYNQSPIIDFEELISYEKSNQPNFMASYQFPIGAGGVIFDINDIFYYPKGDEVGKIALSEEGILSILSEGALKETLSIAGFTGGWFAWVDPENKSGLAVFADNNKTSIKINSYLGKSMTLGTNWSVPTNTLLYGCDKMQEGNELKVKFRFLALTDEEGNYIRDRYQSWINPPQIEVGIPETRGQEMVRNCPFYCEILDIGFLSLLRIYVCN